MLNWIFKAVNWLGEVACWVKCHTITRYHLLDLRDRGEGHGYKWGWMDRDYLALLACFTLLRDFVEKEDPEVGLRDEASYYNPGHDVQPGEREEIEAQIFADKEIRDLYKWWIEGRAKEHAEVEALIDHIDGFSGIATHPNFAEYCRRDEELDDKDDAQLLRFVKIRGYLWT